MAIHVLGVSLVSDMISLFTAVTASSELVVYGLQLKIFTSPRALSAVIGSSFMLAANIFRNDQG